MLDITIGLLIATFVLIYVYFTKSNAFWKKKGVVFVKPYPVIGSLGRVIFLQEHISQFFKRVYFQYPNEPYVGYFQGPTPTLLIRDADLAKRIITTDFSYFTDHNLKFSEKDDPLLTKNLFNMRGQKWKDMRSKLSPTFTTGRMKMMFPLVLKCARTLEKYTDSLAKSGSSVELKDLFARYTLNVIGSTVFGIECNCINDPSDIFSVMGKKLLENNLIRALKVALITFMPGAAEKLGLTFFNKSCEPYFRSLVKEMMSAKNKLETSSPRRDFLQILMELKEKGKLNDDDDDPTKNSTANGTSNIDFTDEDILAQALVFFFAGFETSSTALSFAIFELAHRPELQKKARHHIEEVLAKHDGELSYQALVDMTYLDWILLETLRKYPTLAIYRECTKNYKIPDSELIIEKGTPLVIPIDAFQMDPKYFKNPEKFEPERFGDEELVKKNQYVFMPFGEGPRQCIGMRFAKMQSKLALISVLRNFQVSPNPQTKYPILIDTKQFLLSPTLTYVNISNK